MDRDKVFLEVFKHVNFPKMGVDLRRLDDYLAGKHTESFVGIRLSAPASKRTALVSAWRGILANLYVEPPIALLIATMLWEQSSGLRLAESAGKSGKFSIGKGSGRLLWREESPWPAAYSTLIEQLIGVSLLHTELLDRRRAQTSQSVNTAGFAESLISTVSEYPRHMPTEVLYAFASLGAWLGGSTNIQYLSYYATIRQIVHQDLNVKYATRMGYSPQEAAALHEGGLAMVPLNLYADVALAQDDGLVFGSIPIDEFNFANLPAQSVMDTLPITEPYAKFPGLMMDKFYRTPFWARKIGKHALLGAKNVFRDHYEEFYRDVDHESLVRCKHYCAPVIRVSSMEDIRSIVARIPQRGSGGIFYRGQSRLHLLNRTPEARQILFGDSCDIEPSLITFASRDLSYSYDRVHYALRLFLEQKLIIQDRLLGENRTELWRDHARSPACTLDRAIMAMAQHYGLPTHGLDVTRDVEVAAWFASNRYRGVPSKAHYEPMQVDSWDNDVKEWPTVVVCQSVTHSTAGSLHDCAELNQFGFEARRPHAQSALLFQGGHSDHVNRLAETVVCILRLAPGNYNPLVNFDALFPSPHEDPAYKTMLEFSQSPQFDWSRQWVNSFHA